MGCGSSNSGAAQLLQANQRQNRAVNADVSQIQNAFSGFNPTFYGNMQQAYQNYAMPQLQQQYKGMSDNLGFKMANQGLQKSSQAQQAYGALSDSMKNAQTQIGQQGQQYVNSMKQQVAGQEGNLIGMAETANSPGQIIPQTMATVSSLQGPSTFAPIGQMLNSFASQYLGGQQANLGNSIQQMLQPFMLGSQGGGYSGFIPSNS